jgi:glycosyltransferase involved in cell wall biosynthesis
MKVLVIEPCHVGFGGYFRAYNLSLALSKKGIKVDLLVSSNKNFELRIKLTKINENFRQYELPRINLNPRINFTGRVLRGFIGLVFAFKKKYDIYHVFVPTQFEANIPGYLLKICKKKVIMDWDDYYCGSQLFDDLKYTRKYLEFCETRAPKFFENFTVVSGFLGDMAKERGAIRILKIINGVNREQFVAHSREESRKKLELDSGGKYLLAFGNNYAGDRGLLLLQTFEKIYELDPGVKLMFNFDPKKIVEDNGLEGKVGEECFQNIINVGYINQEDLGYYLGACDAAIHLQGETLDQRAGYPVRVGSYLNGGAAVILNDTDTEVGNTLKKHGCAIMEKDISDLARKTVEFLNDPVLQRKIKNNVIQAKKDISWDSLAVDLIDFYDEIKAL